MIGGKDDTAGFASFCAAQFQLASTNVSLAGRCMCQRTFGVQSFQRF